MKKSKEKVEYIIILKGKDYMKVNDDNLRNLIILCTYNIKGLTTDVEIKKFLPIKNDKLEIYEDSNMLIFKSQGKIVGELLKDNNMYSNMHILNFITPIYGVECKNFKILDLMKYRNNIIMTLI